MAQKPETVFRQRVDKKLKQIPNSWWESISQNSIIGTPDKIGCVAGRFIGLEFKKSANAKRGKIQEYKGKKINEAGGLHFFVYPENWEEVYMTLLNISQLPMKG